MIDLSRINQAAKDYIDNLPHPKLPQVKVKDYESFARVAARLNEAPRPSPEQVTEAYHVVTNSGLSPSEFERLWDVAKPLANRLLGRDPSIQELAHLNDAHPSDIHSYYTEHPHPDYPEVKAGDMAKYLHAATPIAQKLVGRRPIPLEVARFAAAGYETDDIAAHYSDGKSTKQ